MKLKQNLENTIYGVQGFYKTGVETSQGIQEWFQESFWNTTEELRKKYNGDDRKAIRRGLLLTSPIYFGALTGLYITLNYLYKDKFSPEDTLLTSVYTIIIPGIDRLLKVRGEDINSGLVGSLRGMWQYFIKKAKHSIA